MSKDVVIAGAIVAACLGLVTVAFVLPKHKGSAKPVDTSTTLDSPDAGNGPPAPPPVPDSPSNPPGDSSANAFNTPGQPGSGSSVPGHPSSALPSFQGTPQNPPGFHPPTNPFPAPVSLPPPITDTPSPATTEVKTHLVVAGETLGEISMKYYGTSKNWKKIAEANKVDPSDLQPGQKLTIPAIDGAAKPGKEAAAPEAAMAAGEHAYKVKVGDSYYNIAKRELGNANRWKELEKLNGIPAEELHAGQTIKLPTKEATATATAPTTGSEPAPGAGNGHVHIVAAGDTLAEISKKYFGTTTKWKEIVKANPGVDPEALKVGQKLNLPEGASTSPSTAPGAAVNGAPETSGGSSDYVVKAGDSLEQIAQSELGSRKAVKRLLEANPGLDAKHMRIGQKLKIPGKAKAPESTSPAPTPGAFGSPGSSTPPNGFGPQPNGFGTPPGLGPTPSLPPAPNALAPGGAFGTPTYPAPPPAGAAGQPGFGNPTPPGPPKPAFSP